jgi:hypothetical protein
MTWLEEFCGIQQSAHDPYRNAYSSPAQQQRDAMNLMAKPFLPPTALEQTLVYFRKEGLTNEQIRKAITPALFAALREVK